MVQEKSLVDLCWEKGLFIRSSTMEKKLLK